MIEIKNLVKRYGAHNAVDHLSFTVEDGQVFGFLGPNGAGKSTTMNLMTGYLAPTEGEIWIEGHDLLAQPEAAKRCIGYLPEQPPLSPDLTVGEFLRFAAELKGIPKGEREQQIQTVLTLTHLEDMEPRLIGHLSKGYRQRVGLAQAILGFPKVILLDEPTVGLDPKQVVEIRELIRQLSRKHTILISSHILSEIRAVCDRVLIIRKGRFVACDRPEALEATLSAAGELELEVRGEESAVREVLQGLTGILETELLCHQQDRLRFRLRTERDLRESLFFAFAEAKLPLLELQPRRATLEDVFLDLTAEDDAVAAAAAALLRGKTSSGESSGNAGTEPDTDKMEEQEGVHHESDL